MLVKLCFFIYFHKKNVLHGKFCHLLWEESLWSQDIFSYFSFASSFHHRKGKNAVLLSLGWYFVLYILHVRIIFWFSALSMQGSWAKAIQSNIKNEYLDTKIELILTWVIYWENEHCNWVFFLCFENKYLLPFQLM